MDDVNEHIAYVVKSSDGAYLDGFRDGGAVVWTTGLQGVDPYTKRHIAENDAVMARSTKRWNGDEGAQVVEVTIDDCGYLHEVTA